MANPFISGRIPEDLFKKIEDHCKATNQNKTDILIKALCQYLDYEIELPLETKHKGVSEDDFRNLADRVKILENTIETLREIKLVKEKEEEIKADELGREIHTNITTAKLAKLTNINRRIINKFIQESVQLIKSQGGEIVPLELFKKPVEIDYNEPILINEHPYKIFYLGEDKKGSPLWDLLPIDNK